MFWRTAALLLVAALSESASGASNVCEQEMATAALEEQIPLGLLYAVGLTETGRKGRLHPYALNIEGRSVFARTKAEAIEAFNDARRSGKTLIDLGCMQINHHYHGAEFISLSAMLDPKQNVRYAARFLRELKKREGSWSMAVARYHAGPTNNPAQKRYICAVITNMVATGFGNWTPEASAFCEP